MGMEDVAMLKTEFANLVADKYNIDHEQARNMFHDMLDIIRKHIVLYNKAALCCIGTIYVQQYQNSLLGYCQRIAIKPSPSLKKVIKRRHLLNKKMHWITTPVEKEVADFISKKYGITYKQAMNVFRDMLKIIRNNIVMYKGVTLYKIGRIYIQQYENSLMGRCRRVAFKPSYILKKQIQYRRFVKKNKRWIFDSIRNKKWVKELIQWMKK